MFAFADLACEVMQARYGDDPAAARVRYLATSGVPFREQLEILHPGHPFNEVASREFESRKRTICNAKRMSTRTVKALQELRARRVKLVVSSNSGQSFVDEFASREAFVFDLALGFDPQSQLAKGEAHFGVVRLHFDVTPDGILFIGDSRKDAEIARRSGVRFVGRRGHTNFEHCFPGTPTIDEVPDLLRLLEMGTAEQEGCRRRIRRNHGYGD
jgi:phosphoglycolate phosphatase-like HAD superfamily hydrolase